MTDKLERIIRPIVEGQIRGFLKEHPPIVEAVDWFKPSKDKTMTFINSLAKRIVRDLTCASTSARLAAALSGNATGLPSKQEVAAAPASCGGGDGRITVPAAKPLSTSNARINRR